MASRRNYFTFHSRVREIIKELQYKTFFRQNCLAVGINIPALIMMAYVINTSKDWGYDSNVIMSNLTFNVATAVIIFMGLVSVALSFEPNWRKMFQKLANSVIDKAK